MPRNPEPLAPWILLAAATILLALPSAGRADQSGWTPESSDLLFTSSRDGNADVFVLKAGQREWTNLTKHPSGDNWPVWSPDGERIVFQSRRAGSLDIWVMNADGSSPSQLTTDPDSDYLPAWTSDGKQVFFTSWRRESGDTVRAPHLYVMNADGSGQRRLVAASLETSAGATPSPDGKRIVYSRKTPADGADILLADIDGKNERPLTKEKDLYNGTPIFSPDGSWIAFYADDGKSSALVVMQADGSGRRTVLSEGQNWYPRWSPDSKWLVYTASAPGGGEANTDILAIPITGAGKPVPLASSASRELEASWRPKP